MKGILETDYEILLIIKVVWLFKEFKLRAMKYWLTCHSRVNGNPEFYQFCVNFFRIPAFAGMTRLGSLVFHRSQLVIESLQNHF